MKKKLILSLLVVISIASVAGQRLTRDTHAATYSTKAECAGNVLTVTGNAPGSVTANTAFSVTNVSSTSTAPPGITLNKIVSTSSVSNATPATMVGTWTGTGANTFTATFPDVSLTASGAIGSQIVVKLSSIDLYVAGFANPITCSLANGQLTASKPGESLTLLSVNIAAPVAPPATQPTPAPSTTTTPKTTTPTTTSTTPAPTTTPAATPTPTTTADPTPADSSGTEAATDTRASNVTVKPKPHKSAPLVAIGAAALVLVIIAGSLGYWFFRRQRAASVPAVEPSLPASSAPNTTLVTNDNPPTPAFTPQPAINPAPAVITAPSATETIEAPQPVPAIQPTANTNTVASITQEAPVAPMPVTPTPPIATANTPVPTVTPITAAPIEPTPAPVTISQLAPHVPPQPGQTFHPQPPQAT